MTSAPAFDAVILAGGRARRMGGIDKPALEVGGTSLLERAVDAGAAAERIVVVGPTRSPAPATDVEWVLEAPPGGGPVAALAAGLARTSTGVVLVLGADLPAIDSAAVASLAGALAGDITSELDGVIGVDDAGRDQYLCAAYRADRIRARLAEVGNPAGASMRTLLHGLTLARLPLGAKAADIDTPEDLTRFS